MRQGRRVNQTERRLAKCAEKHRTHVDLWNADYAVKVRDRLPLTSAKQPAHETGDRPSMLTFGAVCRMCWEHSAGAASVGLVAAIHKVSRSTVAYVRKGLGGLLRDPCSTSLQVFNTSTFCHSLCAHRSAMRCARSAASLHHCCITAFACLRHGRGLLRENSQDRAQSPGGGGG